MGENKIMLKSITEYLNKILTKLFGSKPTISSNDSKGSMNITGNSNHDNNIDNSVNTYNTPKTELETKKEILIYKSELYKHMLSYRQHIFEVDVRRLADLDVNKEHSDYIKELENNINIEIDLLKIHYPDLCELAKTAFNSISNYHSQAIPYGILKDKITFLAQRELENEEDKKDYDRLMSLYNQRSSEIEPYKCKVEDSFVAYMNENRK